MVEILDVRGYDPLHHNLFGLDVLHQDEKWCDAEGNTFALADMSSSHRTNLLAFLRRRAQGLALKDTMVAMCGPMAPRGDMACDAAEAATDWQTDHPSEWLEGTPLVKALRELVAIDEARERDRARNEAGF